MAKKKRAFSSDNVRTKKEDYHGSFSYERTSPDVAAKGIKSINIDISFEEATQLSLSIQSALLGLNRYNRSTTEGRQMGLCLSVKTDSNAISVIEAKVRPAN